jgi:hypothetical protein
MKIATVRWAKRLALIHITNALWDITTNNYRGAESSARLASKYMETAAEIIESKKHERRKGNKK